MSDRGNEEAVCDVVMQHLESRCGLSAADPHTTENDSASDPGARVDRRFRLGDVSYALEHTIVEPYEREARDWAHRRNLTRDGVRKLPPDFEESALKRFVRAFESKRDKLKRCQSLGKRTALVLEDEHILHSHSDYAQMMDRVPQNFLSGMDSVYLVETGNRHVWYISLLMSDGLFMRPDLDGRWPEPVTIERHGTGEGRGADA